MKWINTILVLLSATAAFSRQAPDFDMESRDGASYSLDSMRTPLTLLYLTNIDCDICEEASDSIASSTIINNAIADGQLTVLSVYIGNDRKGWLRRKPHPQWKECINPPMSVYESDSYDFTYLPAFYLIDIRHEIIDSPQSVKAMEDAITEYTSHK